MASCASSVHCFRECISASQSVHCSAAFPLGCCKASWITLSFSAGARRKPWVALAAKLSHCASLRVPNRISARISERSSSFAASIRWKPSDSQWSLPSQKTAMGENTTPARISSAYSRTILWRLNNTGARPKTVSAYPGLAVCLTATPAASTQTARPRSSRSCRNDRGAGTPPGTHRTPSDGGFLESDIRGFRGPAGPDRF